MEQNVRKKKQDTSRIVPWEPFKAATSPHTKGSPPSILPPLFKYHIEKPTSTAVKDMTDSNIVDENVTLNNVISNSEKVHSFPRVRPVGDGKESSPLLGVKVMLEEKQNFDAKEQINKLKKDLELQIQLTNELKRLLVATMGDDLSCHVQSLSEDKVRLAHRMTKFEAQSTHDHDRAEDLAISTDMWRCKFLAMSIRADELRAQRCRLLTHCKQLRLVLSKLLTFHENQNHQLQTPALTALLNEVRSALGTELSAFIERSPCDEKIHKPTPLTSNITITCCKHCKVMAAPTERFHVLSQLDHLQSKYTGTGHADTTRWEWLVNQHRDTYASMIGHPDYLSLIAVCENESRARIKFNLLNQMITPCGPPPEKSPLDD